MFLFYFVFQEGETALHYAADLEPNKGEDMYEDSDIAKLLLEHYADASSVTYLVCTISFFYLSSRILGYLNVPVKKDSDRKKLLIPSSLNFNNYCLPFILLFITLFIVTHLHKRTGTHM